MARLQTQVILPCWRMATRKPEKGKKLTGFVLKQQMGECVDFTTKFRSCSLFSFQTAISLLLWAGCYRHKETLLLLHLSLASTSVSGNVITKLMKTWDLLALIPISGGGRRESTIFFPIKKTILVKEHRESQDPPQPPANTLRRQGTLKSTGHHLTGRHRISWEQ